MVIIKDELKRHGLTLLEVSQKIGVSRPTLDKYIQQYESNNKIKKEPFQELFDNLFSQGLSTDEFLNLINTWGVEPSNFTSSSQKNMVYEYFLSYSHETGIDRGAVKVTEKINSMKVINELERYIASTHGLANVKIISFNLLNREVIQNELVRDFSLLD